MNRQFYSKRHFDRLSNGGSDTPETIAARKAWYAVIDQAKRECHEKFPVLNDADTAMQAIRWQEERIRELSQPLFK